MNTQILFGSACALFSTLVWSGSFVTARLVVGDISPTLLGTVRWVIGLAILSIFTYPTVKREWKVAKTFLPQIFFASLTGVVAYPILAYMAAETSSTLTMSLIKGITSPLIVIICALFGEKQSKNTWGGSFVALLGTFYLICEGDINRLMSINFVIGDIFMLAAAFGFAIYTILLRKSPEGLSRSTILTLMMLCAVVLLVPYTIWEAYEYGMVFKPNVNVLFTIFYASVISAIGAWGAWNLALIKIGASFSSMIYYSMPLWSGLLGYIVLGEAITQVHYISGILIVGGIVWAGYTPKQSKST